MVFYQRFGYHYFFGPVDVVWVFAKLPDKILINIINFFTLLQGKIMSSSLMLDWSKLRVKRFLVDVFSVLWFKGI